MSQADKILVAVTGGDRETVRSLIEETPQLANVASHEACL